MSNERLEAMKRDGIDDCIGHLCLALNAIDKFEDFHNLAEMIQWCIDRAKYDQGRV